MRTKVMVPARGLEPLPTYGLTTSVGNPLSKRWRIPFRDAGD
jgi:hypothetical protein